MQTLAPSRGFKQPLYVCRACLAGLQNGTKAAMGSSLQPRGLQSERSTFMQSNSSKSIFLSMFQRRAVSSTSPCRARIRKSAGRNLRPKKLKSSKETEAPRRQGFGKLDEPVIHEKGYNAEVELKTRIDKLESEMDEMRKGGILSSPEFMATLSAEDRKKLQAALKEQRQVDEVEDVAAKSREQKSLIRTAAPKEQKISLNRLNGYIKRAAKGLVDRDTRSQLWRWYVRCKQSVPGFMFRVPDHAWEILWETFSEEAENNPDRAAHVKKLAQDLTAMGRQLTPEQKLAYIEALFVDGEERGAIQEWEAAKESMSASSKTLQQHLIFGSRLLAVHNNPGKAQEIAIELFEGLKVDGATYKCLIPIICSWTRQGSLDGFRRAWMLYVRLHDHAAKEMAMEDYDILVHAFLRAGRTDLALGVFKDMMLHQDKSASSELSAAVYRKALGTVSDLHSMAFSAQETDRISLEAMTILPRRFQNKFFYGSWIKKLLGSNDPDNAFAIVKLMYERGVEPDAKQMNGIIGAWIRVGSSEACEKAENLGWDMIERRKKFAFERRAATRGDASGADPEHVPRVDMPSATVETFCILVEYYLQRNNMDQIRWLNRSLGLAEIPANTFFQNRLLRSHLQSDGLRRVWEAFTAWAQKPHANARPDLETFEFLWQCMKFRQTKSPHEWHAENPSSVNNAEAPVDEVTMARVSSGFASCRGLFSSMTKWMQTISTEDLAMEVEEMDKQLYDKIVLSFVRDNTVASAGGDLAGAIVAMHAMKASFAMFPDQHTAKQIILQVSRNSSSNSIDGQGNQRPRRLRREGRFSARMVSTLLEQLAEKRGEFLQQLGNKARNMDAELLRKEENLYLVSELLRVVMASRMRKPASGESQSGEGLNDALREETNTLIQRAAWDMSVGGMHTGDYLQ